MSAMQTQRRDEAGPLLECVSSTGSHHSNTHPYSLTMSNTSNDGMQSSPSANATVTTSVSNLAALVPPSMHIRMPIAAVGRRYSDSSESSPSSRRRKRNSALLSPSGRHSVDDFNMGTRHRSLPPPRHSPSNLSPLRECRHGSLLSDVSVGTAEEKRGTDTPPPPHPTNNVTVDSTPRAVSVSDYAPLPDMPENDDAAGAAAKVVPAEPPKLGRLHFDHEPTVVPLTSASEPAEVESAALAAATPQSSSPVTAHSPLAATNSSENVPRLASSSATTGLTATTTTTTPTPPPPLIAATLDATPVAAVAPLVLPTCAVSTPPRSAQTSSSVSAPSSPHCNSRRHALGSDTDVAKTPSPSAEFAQRPLQPPPLRHGAPVPAYDAGTLSAMSTTPPIAPRAVHSASASNAEARPENTGFTPLPELPPAEAAKRHHHHHGHPLSRSTTPEQGPANRTRSTRRPTHSVQTARARAQQRRTAASSSPHLHETPVAPQAEVFPGAKRLDDDPVPLSTKLVLGTACIVGVALVLYFGHSIYRYASVNITESSTPVPTSKFVRARIPKKAVVTNKEAAKIAREIRDRIVGNMQRAIQVGEMPLPAAIESR